MSPPTVSTTRFDSCWMGVSGLLPPCPAPPCSPAGTSWVTTPMVAEALADSRLKSFESRPANRGFRSSARRIARSISASVASSTARRCSPGVSASGSSCRATILAALEVLVTRNRWRSASRSWASSIRTSSCFARTFSLRCISWVLPVSAENVGEKRWFTCCSACSSGRSSANCWVPAEVSTPLRPNANSAVTTKNARMTRPGCSVMARSTRSTYGW